MTTTTMLQLWDLLFAIVQALCYPFLLIRRQYNYWIHRSQRDGSSDTPLHAGRRRALTLPLPEPFLVGFIIPIEQYTSEQQQSPFFRRLPPEIRRAIYLAVLGPPSSDQALHITHRAGRLLALRCADPDQPWHGWQHECLDDLGPSWGHFIRSVNAAPPPDERLLSLVQTCRRVYSEAINILYTTNTFALRQADCFRMLALRTPPHRLALIQRLHFDTILDPPTPPHYGHGRHAFRVGGAATTMSDNGNGIGTGDAFDRSFRSVADWTRTWRTIGAHMPGLQDVRLSLSLASPAVTPADVDPAPLLTVLHPLRQIPPGRIPSFEVRLTWPLSDAAARALADGPTPFRVTRVRQVYREVDYMSVLQRDV